jgi:hypothetical protein
VNSSVIESTISVGIEFDRGELFFVVRSTAMVDDPSVVFIVGSQDSDRGA